MRKYLSMLVMGMCLGAGQLRADPASGAVEERIKSALNEVVGKARSMEKVDAKRKILGDFLVGMEEGLAKAETHASLGENDRHAIGALQARFHAYAAELNGSSGFDRIADGDLDGFAGFVQQDMEQADPFGGGIYLSAGAIIILLLILLLLR